MRAFFIVPLPAPTIDGVSSLTYAREKMATPPGTSFTEHRIIIAIFISIRCLNNFPSSSHAALSRQLNEFRVIANSILVKFRVDTPPVLK